VTLEEETPPTTRDHVFNAIAETGLVVALGDMDALTVAVVKRLDDNGMLMEKSPTRYRGKPVEVRVYTGRNPDGGYGLIAASPQGDLEWVTARGKEWLENQGLDNYEEMILVAVLDTIAEGPVPD
jgi:hypothetical protein